jgi:pimeloyl-ACP methyl ester carboxylesterase
MAAPMTGVAEHDSEFETGTLNVEGLAFPYLARGAGPLFLCFHGFPDVPRSFRFQLRSYSEAGYRVVAPYMRGFAPTNLAGPYQAARFGRDAIAILDALGEKDAIVLGHDWGTSAAYAAALLAPERIRKLVVAAVPYGHAMPRALLMNPVQQRRSWYMFFFQSRLAEVAVPLGDFAFIDALYRDWSPGASFPSEEIAEVKRTLAQPGVLEAALGYYRIALGTMRKADDLLAEESRIHVDPIAVPTLYVHGGDDHCIGADVSEGMEEFFTGEFHRVVVPGAGHFVHQENPAEFDAAVLGFVGRP